MSTITVSVAVDGKLIDVIAIQSNCDADELHNAFGITIGGSRISAPVLIRSAVQLALSSWRGRQPYATKKRLRNARR